MTRLKPTAEPFTDKIDLFISIGQSNESGRGEMVDPEQGIPQVTTLGNDYVWKQLEEPSDEPAGQVDTVSADVGLAGHSSLVKFGKELYSATGRELTITPCAKGGSRINEWQPPANRYDRQTLFGSADWRAKVSIDNNRRLRAFIWFQGETGAGDNDYVNLHTAMVNKWREYYGNIPFIYCQLGGYRWESDSYQKTREWQRLMESGSGSTLAIPNHYMVVTHDLSNIDNVHLDKAGQIELGVRKALLARQIIYGENINGTGPRLVSVTRDNNIVKVKTSRTINDHNTYEGYFRVYDNGVAMNITNLGRDPQDNTSVLVTLESTPSGVVTLEYRPTERPLHTKLENVVKDSDGLPLPAFGPIELTQ